MSISDITFTLIDDISPYNLLIRQHDNCANYWWRNLLIIQNWYPFEEMCMDWSWTLALQMQLFIAGTLILFAYIK